MYTCQSIWAYTCESSPVSRLLNLYPHVGSVSSNINVLSIHKGEPTISRLLKIIGLFCRISSVLYSSFAKETYQFKEPTNGSHHISLDHLNRPTLSSEYTNTFTNSPSYVLSLLFDLYHESDLIQITNSII